jgi:ribosomal protein S18 acetylase RimI-like enzyme
VNYHLLQAKDEQEKQKFMPLLLLADESEEKIRKYLGKGDLFYLVNSSSKTVGVIVLLALNGVTVEIKNVAISPEHRGKGLGKLLVTRALQIYKEKGIKHFIVGTANSSIGNLAFYQKLGFRMFAIKKDFFLDYPSEIWENGIRAVDLIMLEKEET